MTYKNGLGVLLAIIILAVSCPLRGQSQYVKTDISCLYLENGEKDSCRHIVRARLKEFHALKGSCSGSFSRSLCPLDNELGECEVQEGQTTAVYIHYKRPSVPDQLELVKKNCLHNRGQWKNLTVEAQLLQEMKEAYSQRFDKPVDASTQTAREIKSFSEQILAYLNYILPKKSVEKAPSQWDLVSQKYSSILEQQRSNFVRAAKDDPSWFDPYKTASYREIWNRLAGGCGTLVSFLCTNKLTANFVDVEFFDRALRYKAGSTYEKRKVVYKGHELCPLSTRLNVNASSCDSYDDMIHWRNLGCQIELGMVAEHGAHTEFVYDVFHSRELNICYGISNSWGVANLFAGGSQRFFHGEFSKFANADIEYAPICPCSEESMEAFRNEAIKFYKQGELLKTLEIFQALSEQGYYLVNAEEFAYQGLGQYTVEIAEAGASLLRKVLEKGMGFEKAVHYLHDTKRPIIRGLLYSILIDLQPHLVPEARNFVTENVGKNWYQTEGALNVILKLNRIGVATSSEQDSKDAILALENELFEIRALGLKLLTELVRQHRVDDIKLLQVKLEHEMSAIDTSEEASAYYELLREITLAYGPNEKLIHLVLEGSKNGFWANRYWSAIYFVDRVQKRQNMKEALDTAKRLVRDIDEDIQVEAWILLIVLVKAKHQESLEYGSEYLKNWTGRENFYILEIEKALKGV